MQIANCRKYMEHEQDLNKVIYWLNHAFWDQQTELSADTGIEIARQWQLTSLLRQLQVETCEVQYQGKQAVKIWLSDYGTEISGYLI